jgi:hypothetical protein
MGCLFLFYFLVKNVNLLNTESPRQHCELLGHGVRENLFCGANPKKMESKLAAQANSLFRKVFGLQTETFQFKKKTVGGFFLDRWPLLCHPSAAFTSADRSPPGSPRGE